jgi:4-amino-4-deoxy-L-arabinose transferase-like glycosyltransferase
VTEERSTVAAEADLADDSVARGQHRWGRRLLPRDEPAWARAAVLALAAVAALVYARGAGNYLEIYYAAAVRSMSMSWHNFFFASFDPAGTVTLDKLPGAFWVQALSVRLFGVRAWALVLPQAVEGVLTVLVSFHALRRLAGPVAGIVAAAIFVASPAVATLNRGNISDTLMILLVALAADSMVTAVIEDRFRSVLLAGVWVGLAFQAKMLEAWLVLPALALVYVVAAPSSWRRRCLGVGALGVVTIVVSLSWMTAVSATPATHRPYVDGSHDNSIFGQVFVYNGFGRVDEQSPDQILTKSIGLEIGNGTSPPAAWNRLLTGSLGLDTGWLLPASLVVLVAGLLARRKEPRTDLLRASLLLWGGWLVAFFVVFSLTSTINPYYTAALTPAVGGLLATGVVLAWRQRRGLPARLTVAGAVLATVGYALWVLPDSATGLPAWLKPAVISLGLLAACSVVLSGRRAASTPLHLGAFVTALVAIGMAPTVATASVVAERLGPFDTPFQQPVVTNYIRQFFIATPAAAAATLPTLEEARNGATYLMAVQTSVLAATFIYHSGLEVLPIGGFTGTVPEPSLSRLQSMIEDNDFHLVLQSPTTTDPRLVWIAHHCFDVGDRKGAGPPSSALDIAVYYCLPGSVGPSP